MYDKIFETGEMVIFTQKDTNLYGKIGRVNNVNFIKGHMMYWIEMEDEDDILGPFFGWEFESLILFNKEGIYYEK